MHLYLNWIVTKSTYYFISINIHFFWRVANLKETVIIHIYEHSEFNTLNKAMLLVSQIQNVFLMFYVIKSINQIAECSVKNIKHTDTSTHTKTYTHDGQPVNCEHKTNTSFISCPNNNTKQKRNLFRYCQIVNS